MTPGFAPFQGGLEGLLGFEPFQQPAFGDEPPILGCCLSGLDDEKLRCLYDYHVRTGGSP